MASRWRFRHKLILAHGLVVAIVLLLLSGTLYGLISYRSTTRAFEKKMLELSKAEEVRNKVKSLADNARNDLKLWNDHIGATQEGLREYQGLINDYAPRDENLPFAFREIELVQGLNRSFERLQETLRQIQPYSGQASRNLSEDPEVLAALDLVRRGTEDLVALIRTDLGENIIHGAYTDYRLCLWFVLAITGIGIVLMTGSLRFFYQWIFYPIRDLQEGVAKVAQGDFKHDIRIKSSDEIQDLAAAFNDMTHRLDEMYTDLARQVNERSRQLVRSERLASVGFLAAGVAHEINNPLASIAFCSEALERRILDLLGPQSQSGKAAEETKVVTKYLKMIQQESFRCKEITSRLLEFSRGGEPRREPTEMSELIQSVLDMVQHLQNRQGKQIYFNPTQRVVALVNALEIKSVVVNLVVNALDSMDEGGTLEIAIGMRDGMAEMTFRDSGCGMTNEVLENIFEPFFTKNRSGKGTGLGLSICHRIVNQHRGEIEAHSAGPNQGSLFVVRLPTQPANEDSPSSIVAPFGLGNEPLAGSTEQARARPSRLAA